MLSCYHSVAHLVVPDTKVVYVDYDPDVLEHSRRLLAGESNVVAVDRDLRQPKEILQDPRVLSLIDFKRPVAVLLVTVLHFTKDGDYPYAIVEELKEAMAPGSYLVSAEPNAFPDGPVTIGGKPHGFQIGAELGDPLTGNTRRMDAYRFHDAIHLGFLAVLGWSPTMRALLRLKRKSSAEADECEDGARAIFAEEGLAAVLSGWPQAVPGSWVPGRGPGYPRAGLPEGAGVMRTPVDEFREAVRRLHRAKDAAYRDAWKRRGEVLSMIYDLYWYFASERQQMFARRVTGEPGPWTDDPILREFKFCNVFRAADRVSQYMIRDVCYHDGHPAHDPDTLLDAWVRELIEAAPPLTGEQRRALALLLRGPGQPGQMP